MMTMTMIIIVIIFIIMFMQIMTAVGCHLFDLIAYVFLKGFYFCCQEQFFVH